MRISPSASEDYQGARRGLFAVIAALVCVLATAPARAQRPTQGDDESATLVVEGREALKRNDLDDAARALDQSIALNPRRVEAYVLRSAVYAAKRKYKDGVALLRKAQALAPTDAAVLTALGSQLVLAGEPGEGVPLLQQVVAKDPARYDAQLLLGHHWHDAGAWRDAVTALEAYFASRPAALAGDDAKNHVELADAYLRAGQARQALAMFQQAQGEQGLPATQLRAKLGEAWALAAIDCRRARAQLAELEAISRQHPEVLLVDGECALSLGDATAALALGRRYLDRTPPELAAGHALVGEALAARGDLAEARKELETAHELEPNRRRWTVRLASILRRAGRPGDGMVVLDKLGPPETPAGDPVYWAELGENVLAQGDAAGAAQRLEPVATALASDAGVQIVYGDALLRAGKPDAAAAVLEAAVGLAADSARGKHLLATALAQIAAARLGANDAAHAEQLLARADQLDGSAIIWRDLGIARLALDRPADAIAPLDRAAKADPSPTVAMLAARAHALTGDVAGARPIYERALGAARDEALEIAIDWAASEVSPGGDPAVAVAALEKTAPLAKSGALAQRHKQALAEARHAAGLAQLEKGNGAKALELLKASAAAEPTLPRRCDLAVAAVASGDPAAALSALRAVAGQTCPFPPPADTQAVAILIAFTEGLQPRRAARALDALTALGGKATGASAALLGTAIRVVALNAAEDAYRNGQLAQARRFLASARTANARVGADEVAHNLAVLDLADGHVDAAIPELERLAGKVPEAWVSLGIAYERKGDHVRALDAWQRAKKAGVRFAPLGEWIDAKERIYGAGGAK